MKCLRQSSRVSNENPHKYCVTWPLLRDDCLWLAGSLNFIRKGWALLLYVGRVPSLADQSVSVLRKNSPMHDALLLDNYERHGDSQSFEVIIKSK